ncbi:2-amino-4-hydroxy-6-hydroxymethyldihydropteridine diphosphokinase [Candidatus Pelagibacter communis]|uniref:2-amino-4-hydroxy-6-hydroxymethyldihydropteridine pyrophosphokinase n=1 Tax=Pelagibacter ubique (strain HTCC1062) TaxID=335992 RepID=Q4FLS3_PELUB|nr:2-amino-4-hydroxy-6-hydroxymethyldihydropteridine diphosphokinase [Candidatus Pelagibacter ubique]AAZ21865.1 7,8-dihydro-6-hydroxymethylpterin-pyrophosphokinase (HPPK) [Candidatus Pelagibacter ubique HTCC1062]
MKKQDILENQVKQSYLAIGSNLGNKITNIHIALSELKKNKIKIKKVSSHYLSKSWPNPLMPSFINIVIEIETILTPLELLEICNNIELKLGRVRLKKNAPRTCDIDIIDYDKKILNINSDKLIIPHPEMTKRNFVLLPLFEINRSWKHPESKINIVNLINSLSIKDLRSIKQI